MSAKIQGSPTPTTAQSSATTDAQAAIQKQAGLAAELRLEHGTDKTASSQNKDMYASFLGYEASHPDATLGSFAKQEAAKTHQSASDIEAMIHAGASEAVNDIANIPITRKL